jgi:hypothetical protein
MNKLRVVFFTLSILVLGITLEPRATLAAGTELKAETAIKSGTGSDVQAGAAATAPASTTTDTAVMANSETQKQKKAAAKTGEQQAKASKPKMESGY